MSNARSQFGAQTLNSSNSPISSATVAKDKGKKSSTLTSYFARTVATGGGSFGTREARKQKKRDKQKRKEDLELERIINACPPSASSASSSVSTAGALKGTGGSVVINKSDESSDAFQALQQRIQSTLDAAKSKLPAPQRRGSLDRTCSKPLEAPTAQAQAASPSQSISTSDQPVVAEAAAAAAPVPIKAPEARRSSVPDLSHALADPEYLLSKLDVSEDEDIFSVPSFAHALVSRTESKPNPAKEDLLASVAQDDDALFSVNLPQSFGKRQSRSSASGTVAPQTLSSGESLPPPLSPNLLESIPSDLVDPFEVNIPSAVQQVLVTREAQSAAGTLGLHDTLLAKVSDSDDLFSIDFAKALPDRLRPQQPPASESKETTTSATTPEKTSESQA